MSNFLVSIWLGVLRIILTFIHLIYSGLQYFDLAWALFKRKFEDIIQLQVSDTQLYVSRFVTNLEKCPTHLAVIVGSESIPLEDFTNIVIWCLAAGISFVSFYDHTGFLKEKETIYYKYLLNKRKLDTNKITLMTPKLKNGVTKNGFSPKIHVNIFSIEEGKNLCVNLIAKLSEAVSKSEMKLLQNLDVKFVDKELQSLTGYPDPDLALVCGDVMSTFGFLPWQIRVTEFIRLKTIEGLRAIDFTSLLKQYSTCQQRFGK